MRAFEFLVEKIVKKDMINGIHVWFNDHALDRAHEREVSPRAVDAILERLHTLVGNIESVEPHYEFWVYYDAFSTGAGFRRMPDKGDALCVVLNTVISDPPHEQGSNPVFYIR
jgi:hypothetical protein